MILKKMKQTIYEAITIFLVAAVISLAVNQLRPNGINLKGNANLKKTGYSLVKEISIDDAIEMFMKKKVLFIDSRSKTDFLMGHIQGAINLPEKKFDERIDDFLTKTDPDTIIITYCNGIDCPLARSLAEKLLFVGYYNVFYLTDGWSKWQKNADKERGKSF